MATKKPHNFKQIDDKEYWKDRHKKTSNLKASGVKSVGVKSNHYIYKILEEQYLKLLNQIDLTDVKSVLDSGFGDGYFLKFYSEHFPDLKLAGVDISPQAKKKIDFIPKNSLYVSDLVDFSPGMSFDVVHCFDVLYHILSDEDYVAILKNFAKLSNRYIILHERFMKRSPLISSKHVRLRSAKYTNQTLNSQGFFLTKEMPTHFLAMRLPTYKLNKLIPKVMYGVDSYIASHAHPSVQQRLASHRIRVYTKDKLS